MSKFELVDVQPDVVKGTCKWFHGTMGFFVTPDGKDVFVHITDLPTDSNGRKIEPVDGSEVHFQVGRRLKDGEDTGLGATNIKVFERFDKKSKKAA